MRLRLNLFSNNSVLFRYFATEQDMLDYYQNYPTSLWAGVVINKAIAGESLDYKIRLNGTYLPFTIKTL